MASDSEPRRVEIELTPTGADATRRSRSPDRRVGDRDAQSGSRPDRIDDVSIRTSSDIESTAVGQRIVIVGAVAAILGLAGGWLLGSSVGSRTEPTDDAEVASVTTPTTTGSFDPASSTLEPIEPIETIETVPPTTTVRPQRTVTTITLPGPQSGPVAVHPTLAGRDIRLVGVTGPNTTSELDLAAVTLTTRNWGSVSLDPSATLIGDGWVVAPSLNSGSVTLVTGDGDRSNPRIGEAWSLLPIDGGDRFWRPVDLAMGPVVQFEEVDRSGEPTGLTIETQGVWPVGVDPVGGILAMVQGSTYSVGPDRTELIGDGEMVAVSGAHAVLSRCDAAMACSLVLVDRATAEERIIPGGADATPFMSFGFVGVRSDVSPDGEVLALADWGDSGQPTLSVVDTTSGVGLVLSERSEGGVAWSPDGRFGFFTDGSRLMFYDHETGEIDEVGDDIGTWRSVDVLRTTG